jgi:multidrug efflux system outer membrane protein
MNMKTNILTILLAAVLVSSCGIYTNYKRPEDRLPDTDSLYRDAQTGDTSSIADLSWRELFTDPYLVKWIEKGLESNTDLQTARLRTEEAKASMQAAKLSFLPSLSGTAQGQLSSYDGAKPTKTYSLGGSAEWEVDIFGSLRNSAKQGIESYEGQKAYEQAVQTQLIATIATNYYSLLTLDKQLEITSATVESWKENVKTMEALKKAGQYNEAAVEQARANLLEAQSQEVSLKKQIHQLENSFSTLLGMPAQSIERGDLLELDLESGIVALSGGSPSSGSANEIYSISNDAASSDAFVSSSDSTSTIQIGIPAQLLSRRPDVRQSEHELAQAFYATNEARSAFYPQVTLSGSAGWTNSGGAVIENPGKWLLTAVGNLVQPIFSRGQNVANLKIAKAQQEEALLAFSQKLLDAGAEVNDALTDWQASQATLELDSQRVASLERTVDVTEKLMKNSSTTTYLEVLTAQQSLLSAQLTEVEDKYSEISAVIDLYHALGGGAE